MQPHSVYLPAWAMSRIEDQSVHGGIGRAFGRTRWLAWPPAKAPLQWHAPVSLEARNSCDAIVTIVATRGSMQACSSVDAGREKCSAVVRRAAPGLRLGLQRDRIMYVPLHMVHPEGGVVPATVIVVQRIYPMLHKDSIGVMRTPKAHSAAQALAEARLAQVPGDRRCTAAAVKEESQGTHWTVCTGRLDRCTRKSSRRWRMRSVHGVKQSWERRQTTFQQVQSMFLMRNLAHHPQRGPLLAVRCPDPPVSCVVQRSGCMHNPCCTGHRMWVFRGSVLRIRADLGGA